MSATLTKTAVRGKPPDQGTPLRAPKLARGPLRAVGLALVRRPSQRSPSGGQLRGMRHRRVVPGPGR